MSLKVIEPSGVARHQWPLTSGIPLARGALKNAGRVKLFDGSGKQLPLQTESLVRWPDGSIRWLLVDSLIDLQAGKTAKLNLRYDREVNTNQRKSQKLQIDETKSQVTVITGALKITVSKQQFRLLDQVWIDRNKDGRYSNDERVTASTGAGIELRTPGGELFRADGGQCEIRVEQRGPIRACLRIEGHHRRKTGKMFRYVVRLHFWRGQPFVRMHYTFINDNTVKVMSPIKSLELVFAHRGKADKSGLLSGSPTTNARLFQVDERSYQHDGKTHKGRATGWAYIGSDQSGMAVGVREFWQNWPKSLAVESSHNGTLRVGILPSFNKGLYDNKPLREEAKLYYYLRNGEFSFKVGAARTHELWARFSSGRTNKRMLSNFFAASERPLLAQCSPQHVRATRAVGNLAPANASKYFGYEQLINEFLEDHLKDRRQQRSFGLLNYGDWYLVRTDSWGNLEYDMPRCFFTQYLRSGDRRFFDRAEQAAKHYIDVDVAHALNAEVLAFGGSNRMKPGSIWAHSVGHTGGYFGTHKDRKYYNVAPLGISAPYQIGLSDLGHHWIGGELDYYLLTGDRRALEVGVMASDVIADLCPTPYTDHVRDIGWPLNMMVDAYMATGNKKYLAAAGRQWARLKSHLDPKKGFLVMLAFGHCNERSVSKRCRGQNAYMLGLTLSALARYHQITQDPEVLAGLSAGVEQLIRTCYSKKHKSFFLTSCVHFMHRPPPKVSAPTFLASAAIAYEASVTGNREHLRILRESLQGNILEARKEIAAGKWRNGSGAHSLNFHFTPYSLFAFESEGTSPPRRNDDNTPHLDRAVAHVREQLRWFGAGPAHSKAFYATVATMNYVQSRVSPLRYAQLTKSGVLLPNTPNKCLAMGAGICGGQIMTTRAILNRLGIKNRSVQFYLRGTTPQKNSSHIGLEVFYSNKWHYFDVTWGTFFRRKGDKKDRVLSIAEVLQAPKVDALAVTNKSDLWYQQWTAAGLDPLIYLRSKQRDVVVGGNGTIHLRPNNQLKFTPTHQPNYIGRNTAVGSGLTIRLIKVPDKISTCTISVTGIAGSGQLEIAGESSYVRLSLGLLKTGRNIIDVSSLGVKGSLLLSVKPAKTKGVGYVVFKDVTLK